MTPTHTHPPTVAKVKHSRSYLRWSHHHSCPPHQKWSTCVHTCGGAIITPVRRNKSEALAFILAVEPSSNPSAAAKVKHSHSYLRWSHHHTARRRGASRSLVAITSDDSFTRLPMVSKNCHRGAQVSRGHAGLAQGFPHKGKAARQR